MSRSRERAGVLVALALLAACACVVSACNTVQGLGKDISYIGEKGEEAIQK